MNCLRCSLVLACIITVRLCAGQVWINEFAASNSLLIEDPDFGSSSDWVELHNPGTAPVDLTGWYLTDNTSDTTKWAFPEGTSIEGGGFLMLWCDGEKHPFKQPAYIVSAQQYGRRISALQR